MLDDMLDDTLVGQGRHGSLPLPGMIRWVTRRRRKNSKLSHFFHKIVEKEEKVR